MTDDLSLTAHVVKLATLREEVAQRKAQIAKERATFETSIADQTAKLAALSREVEAEEAAVKGFALVIHEQDGNRRPAPGVEVVMRKEYEIDPDAALEWARVSKMCLIPETVDLKAVQKIAPVQALPFVTVTEVPSVRLATDLTKALASVTQEAA